MPQSGGVTHEVHMNSHGQSSESSGAFTVAFRKPECSTQVLCREGGLLGKAGLWLSPGKLHGGLGLESDPQVRFRICRNHSQTQWKLNWMDSQ